LNFYQKNARSQADGQGGGKSKENVGKIWGKPEVVLPTMAQQAPRATATRKAHYACC